MKSIITLFLSIILEATAVSAQAGPQQQSGWALDVGAGVLTSPLYLGDNNYQIAVLPNIRLSYKNTFFASVQDGIGYNLYQNQNWRVGPIARLNFGRNDINGTSPFQVAGNNTTDLIGLGDIDPTIELGGFVEYRSGNWTFNAELRQAIGGGHEGLVSDIGAQYRNRTTAFGKPVMYSVGPRATLVSENFNDMFFGVNAAQSLASGLETYSASGGLLSFGAGANAIMPLNRSLTLIGFAGYDRLTGDAADAPLVQQRGSPNQFSAGMFLSYRFNL